MTRIGGTLSRALGLLAGAVALVVLGGALTYYFLRDAPRSVAPTAPAPAERSGASPASTGAVSVTLTSTALTRAGIETAEAGVRSGAGLIHVPAVIETNAYRRVMVTAAASGLVLAVPVETGQVVSAGDVLVRLHSPAVADTERALQAALADLDVWEKQVARLERLVAIGAASRQEQEAAMAERVRLAGQAESQRSRLIQLGRTAQDAASVSSRRAPSAEVAILAPSAGTVIERAANAGQNVTETSPLVTIADLSSVWVVGDLYERDLADVREGSAATVTSTAFPGEVIKGRVSYIDPQVSASTRTARLRVEIANPGGRLRPGMFAAIAIAKSAGAAIFIPHEAVQAIDQATVVYVADPTAPGRFTERTVQLGTRSGDEVAVLAGLAPGDQVVTRGSFLIRSERERQFPNAPAPPPNVAPAPRGSSPASLPDRLVVKIAVDATAFTPSEIRIPAGVPVRLVFTRVVEATCATDVTFPALKIKKALPVNQPVTIDLDPMDPGTLTFQCGMNMLRGSVVVGRDGPRTPIG